jgi:hypothetical protein
MNPLLALISLLLLLLSCCKPENNCPDETRLIQYNVSDEAKSKVPYAGYDTIAFRSDAGDTSVMIGSGWIPSYKTEESGNINCPPASRTHLQTLSITFTGNNVKLPWLKVDIEATKAGTFPLTISTVALSQFTSFPYLDYHLSHSPDSIYVNGKFEKGAYLFDYPAKIFLYNYSKGILKFKDQDSTIWQLLK